MKRVLTTGAGTGFGHEAAMRLAEKRFDVIAAVEIWAIDGAISGSRPFPND
jgi:NAD(P)-dependent dehydrogenase (short-subunit alcohol dehydrogenase family)